MTADCQPPSVNEAGELLEPDDSEARLWSWHEWYYNLIAGLDYDPSSIGL